MRHSLPLYSILLLSFAALISPSPLADTTVIFQESFDSQADWNANGSKDGVECTNPCSDAPANWTNYRIMPGSGTWTNPVGSIRRLPGNLPDHNSSSGKAFIVYNQSHPGDNWPGDAILSKTLSQDYPELYIRLYMRTQPGWQWVAGAQSKFVRALHYDGSGNIFQFFSGGNSCPIFVWDLAASSSASQYLTAYRCDPQSSNYYCTGSGVPSFQLNDIFYTWSGSRAPTSAGMYADTNWHRYELHVKMNTIGSNNGVMEWWWDGTLMESRTNVQWKASGSSSGIGWNTVSIGGNSNNSFSQKGDQWYAIDDISISTSTPVALLSPTRLTITN
jgi:hypothetical protein